MEKTRFTACPKYTRNSLGVNPVVAERVGGKLLHKASKVGIFNTSAGNRTGVSNMEGGTIYHSDRWGTKNTAPGKCYAVAF
jgi:hypothetical protein